MNEKLTLEQIEEKILYVQKPFPKQAVEEAIKQQEAMTPKLLGYLEHAIDQCESLDEDYMGHIFASYLLSQFREKKAFPLMLQIARMPEKTIDDIMGVDFLTESLMKVLASTYNGNLSEIKNIIQEEGLNIWSKIAALRALKILALQKTIDHDDVKEYMDELFQNTYFQKDKELMSFFIIQCCEFELDYFYEKIKKAFSKNIVDERITDLNYIDRIRKNSILPQKFYNNELINDTIKEMKNWPCFQEPRDETEDDKSNIWDFVDSTQIVRGAPKIGRNDPCPCESGKKYKKCCLNTEEQMVQ